MNIYPVYIDFPEYNWRPYGLTTENWCNTCRNRIMTMKTKWGREEHSGNAGCPTLFVWNGNCYVNYGVINIHNPLCKDVIREVSVQAEDVGLDNYKAKFRLREGWLGLNFSESFIDQVKLYAVDEHGNHFPCLLIEATHSDRGDALSQLWMSDNWKVQMVLLETVDLTFIVPCQNIKSFIFVIEGCNPYKVP